MPESRVLFDDVTLFYDVESKECKELVEKAIKKNGFAPEHNYDYFISHKSDEMIPIFVDFGNDCGLFAVEWDDNSYQIISEIIAPKEERAELAMKFFDIVLNRLNAKKILVEFPPELRKELLKKSKTTKIKLGAVTNHFYTPMISITNWDPTLEGSKFSNLRKAKNRFFRSFKVEILKKDELLSVDIKEFERIINDWKKGRKSSDKAYTDDYIEFFRNKFKGSACHIGLKLNGKLCGVSAGWAVPGTSGKTVYYAINLHDYSVQELGDFLTLLFFDELKAEGFENLDFGSSDERLLAYKKKFGISSQYDTLVFYVKLDKENNISRSDSQ
ncbi:MAG TPA: phosphatidylglycerol lysyltransferase domain-containing protein [Alphaproteobacteria bacterium]|nr:phosphatidylglycerol lysyltransferase domain-containing protein [Alphaproteobacteria bacterium]